jgi:hypothetical protein
MNNLTLRASRRVRFEEVTPAHEYAHILHQCIYTRIESKLILRQAPEMPEALV